MTKHFFITTKNEYNAIQRMYFSDIRVSSTIATHFVNGSHLSKAVAFSSKAQAMIYLHHYLKPFFSEEDFTKLEIVLMETTCIDVDECLFFL